MNKILTLSIIIALTSAVFTRDVFGKHRIYYINSYHAGYGSSDDVMQGIQQELQGKDVTLKTFFMDTKRHSSAQHIQKVTRQVLAEIESDQPDCIIASDDNAVKYIVAPHFKNGPIPVVFCGVNWSCDQYGLPSPYVTGMLEVLPIGDTVKVLLPFYKGMKKIVVLSENTTSEQSNKRILGPLFKKMGLDVDYALVDTFDQWQQAFIAANQSADLIFVPTNGAVKHWNHDQAVSFVKEYIRIPVFTNDDFMMPYAVIGLTKIAQEQGQWAAQSALRIIKGQKPSAIPVTENQQSRYYLNPVLADKIGFAPQDPDFWTRFTASIAPAFQADGKTVWLEQNGIVKIEAERYRPVQWSLEQSPAGFSGTGYMRWNGSFQHGRQEGFHPAESPLGSEASWMTIRFYITQPGTYRIDLKHYHVHEDGDNDVWLRYPETDTGWHKVGNNKTQKQFDFLKWSYGSNPTHLDAGLHSAWVTGRSRGFGIDYITIYRTDEQGKQITEESAKKIEAASESMIVKQH